MPSVAENPERIVGDYALQRRLGSGAMGEVWLGWHRRSEGPAAIKLLRESHELRGRARRFFDQERRAIGRLSHPNIVGLYEVGPGHIVFRYVDGPNLAQRLQTPIDPATAVRITRQIASALAHAHRAGVVHRDVKPSNIMLDSRGNAYLTDFGLAVILDEDDDAGRLRVGTPGYMAPEQVRGDQVGPAADQYALGRTLLEMLAGGSLAHGDPLGHLPEDLPLELRRAVARAMAPRPADRFPSVDAFASVLAALSLDGYEPPVRLAPEVRLRAPFGWCTAPKASRRLSPDIARADYTLRGLEAAGMLPAGTADDFREHTGYQDLGWSMYAHTSRLGPITQSSALARASDLIVLSHGTLNHRGAWAEIAAALCRNNAQAVVLVPDVLGSGESPLSEAHLERAHLAPRALVDALTRWLDLLSVRDLPTVLVGHSASAVALLSVADAELGERTSRVAVTPVFPFVDAPMRRQLRVASWLMKSVGRVPALKRRIGRIAIHHSPDTQGYTEQARERMYEEFLRVPAQAVAWLTDEVAGARPAPADRLERCVIVVGNDDPLAPEERVMAALRRLGFPERHVHHMAAGGHLPHMENEDHPEWRLRNVDDLVRIVETMLVSSREGAPASTVIASTVLDDGASGVRSGASSAGVGGHEATTELDEPGSPSSRNSSADGGR